MHDHDHRYMLHATSTALHNVRFTLCLTLKNVTGLCPPGHPLPAPAPHVDTIAWHCPLRDAQPLGEFHLYRVPTRPGK